MNIIVENYPATRGVRVNTMGNTKKKFTENEQQKVWHKVLHIKIFEIF